MSRTKKNNPKRRKNKLWDMGHNVFLRSGLHLGNPRKARAKGKQQAHQIQRAALRRLVRDEQLSEV